MALRSLWAFAHSGITAVHMFAAAADGADYPPVAPSFYAAVRAATGGYPGASRGGITMAATKRLAGLLCSDAATTRPRALRLLAVGDYAGRRQFAGDGTIAQPAQPALLHRDVAAVMPFQLDDRSHVIAAYVTSRDLARIRDSSAPRRRPRRNELPAEIYRIRLGGVERYFVTASAVEPLDGLPVAVRVVACAAGILDSNSPSPTPRA